MPAFDSEWWARLPRIVRYGAVAGPVSLGYLGLFALLVSSGLWYLAAIAIAQCVAVSVAFPLYRTFVFTPGASVWQDFVRFLIVWSSGAIAGFIGTPALVESELLSPVPAHIVAVVVVSMLSFAAHRLFSFRRAAGGGAGDREGGES